MAGKGFGKVTTLSKTKIKVKTTTKPLGDVIVACDDWEAWECYGNINNSDNWELIFTGSLEKCFEELREPIDYDFDEAMIDDGSMERLSVKYSHEPTVLTEILQRLRGQRIENIKKQCLKTGEYTSSSWAVYSTSKPVKFKQQIQNKYPFAHSKQSKLKEQQTQKGIFAYSENWEVWEFLGGHENNPDNWLFVADGTLDDCIAGIWFDLSVQLNMQYIKELAGDMDDIQPDHFFDVLIERRDAIVEQIKKSCCATGECRLKNWHFRSQRTKSECRCIMRGRRNQLKRRFYQGKRI